MTTSATQATQASGMRGVAVARTAGPAALGGIVGGIAFGVMMQTMDMLPMAAMLVGSESVAVGWVVHLAISVAAGVGFGVVAGRALGSWARGVGAGAAYGVLWWVFGALIAMPLRLGMPALQLNTMAWQSLMGHLVFGVLLGAVAVAITRRRATGSGA